MTERKALIHCARVYLAQSRHFTSRHRGRYSAIAAEMLPWRSVALLQIPLEKPLHSLINVIHYRHGQRVACPANKGERDERND